MTDYSAALRPPASSLKPPRRKAVYLSLLAGLCGWVMPVAAAAPATVLYVLTEDGQLAITSLDAPSSAISQRPITGVVAGDELVGIDMRAMNQRLYAVGVNTTADTMRLYILNPETATALPLGSPGTWTNAVEQTTLDLPVTAWDVDFHSVGDTMRIVNQTGQNFRMNPNTGALVESSQATANGINPDANINGLTTGISGSAHTNNQPRHDLTSTTIYTLDPVTGGMYIHHTPDTGTQSNKLVLAIGETPIPFTGVGGFDIPPGVESAASGAPVTSGVGYAVLRTATTSKLYSINLPDGQATELGSLNARSIALHTQMGNAVGLSAEKTSFYRFDPLTPNPDPIPATNISPVGTLTAGEMLAAITVRPSTGQLIGLGIDAAADTGTLYLITPRTGALTVIGTASSIQFVLGDESPMDLPRVPTGAEESDNENDGYTIAFNPSNDVLRITSGYQGPTMRVTADGVPIDGNFGFLMPQPGTNPDALFLEGPPALNATVYTSGPAADSVSKHYALDTINSGLYLQTGGDSSGDFEEVARVTVDGETLNLKGPLAFNIVNSATEGYFTMDASTQESPLTDLYKIDLETAEATYLGTSGVWLSSMAVFAVSTPTLAVAPATAVTRTTATLSGTVTTTGGSTILQTGLVFVPASTSTLPRIGDDGVTRLATETEPSFDVIDLAPATTYSYRAYAITALGTGYSPVRSFTTLDPSPLVDTTVGGEYLVDLDLEEGTTAKAKGLPPGLKLNSRTGIISGRATKPGDYEVTITVKGPGNETTTTTYTLSIPALPETAVGTFVAYVDPDADVNADLGNRLDVTTTAKGSYTLKMTQGKRTLSTKGFLTSTEEGSPALAATLPDDTEIYLILDNIVDGEAQAGESSVGITGWRKTYDRSLPATAQAGSYTVGINRGMAGSINPDVPQGSGFATITIGTDGSTKLVGKAADGSALTCAAFLSTDGDILAYLPLYKKLGSLSGLLTLTLGEVNSTSNSIYGDLDLTKPVTTGRAYTAALTQVQHLVSGMYMGPTARITQGLPSATETYSLVFNSGGIELADLNPELDSNVTFTEGKLKATVPTPGSEANPARTTLTFNASKGSLSGSFKLVDGSLKRTVKFQGLLVRTGGAMVATGYFLLPQIPLSGETARTAPILSGHMSLVLENDQ